MLHSLAGMRSKSIFLSEDVSAALELNHLKYKGTVIGRLVERKFNNNHTGTSSTTNIV
jgi:hypothetical protein